MSDLKAKMHPNRFRLWLRPRPAALKPLAEIKRTYTFKERERRRQGKGRRGMDAVEDGGGEEKGGEGSGLKGADSPLYI